MNQISGELLYPAADSEPAAAEPASEPAPLRLRAHSYYSAGPVGERHGPTPAGADGFAERCTPTTVAEPAWEIVELGRAVLVVMVGRSYRSWGVK